MKTHAKRHKSILTPYSKNYKVAILVLFMLTFQGFCLTFSEEPKYETMINTSDLIIEGIVSSSKIEKKQIISYQWDEKGRKKYTPTLIITEYLIKVEKILKGKINTSTLKVWAPFGCLEGKCISQDNFFKLEKGNKLIFFLKLDSENKSNNEPIYWVNGHSLGLFKYVEVEGKQYIKNYYFNSENQKNVTYSQKFTSFKLDKHIANDKADSFKLMSTLENLLEMMK